MATKILPRPFFLDLLQLLSAYSSLQLIYQNLFARRVQLFNMSFVLTASVSLALTLFRIAILKDYLDRSKKCNVQIYISLTASMVSWMIILHGTVLYFTYLDASSIELEPQTVHKSYWNVTQTDSM
jgi:hypothetical protein